MNSFYKNPASLFEIRDKVALITGATGALGRVASLTLAGAGCRLVLAGGDSQALEDIAVEARDLGAKAVTVNRRPDTEDDTDAMVDAAVREYWRLDFVVAAAGFNEVRKIDEFDVERWRKVMDANVLGSWLICKSAGKQLLEQGEGGRVVLISSTRGKLGLGTGYSAYCASKSAVDGIVRALACEWGSQGINVNAIAPTVFRSRLTEWMFSDEEPGKSTREGILSRIPLGRLGEPEDLAGILLFLLAPASAFCTGQIMYVDGGYTAG